MGSSGETHTLLVLPDRPLAPDERIRETLVETLATVWDDFLPFAYRRMTADWIFMGQDSLLTIEVSGPHITFWFYESVAWAEGLAWHWLHLALAGRRRDFELALAPLGLAVDPSDWPNFSSVCPEDRLYFHHDGDVGSIHRGETEISWQLKEYGKIYECPSTPIEELSPEVRAKVAAVIEYNQCLCPVCEARFPRSVLGPHETPEGRQSQLEGVFLAKEITACARPGDQWLVSQASRAFASWTLRGPSLRGPFSTVAELSHARRGVDHVVVSGSSAIAQLGAPSAGERLVSRSSDGGVSWSAPVAVPGLPALKRARFFDTDEPEHVLCAGYPSNEIYLSKDGGASFSSLAKAPALAGDPIRYFRSMAFGQGRLFAIVETKAKAKGIRLCRSSDNGASFEEISFAPSGEPRALLFTSGAVICTGTGGVATSLDLGGSWSMTPLGPNGPTDIVQGPKGLLAATDGDGAGVFFSDDLGRSWSLCMHTVASRVFADPTGSSLGLAFVRGALFSVR